MKMYQGVRQRSNGSYEVKFRPARGAKPITKNIKASSPAEAYLTRAKLMVEAAKAPVLDFSEGLARQELTFEAIWPILERNIISDELTPKTTAGLKKVYNRLFVDFREKYYPAITSPAQLNLPFFLEYKSYYGVELGRPRGLRAETQRFKIIMQRLRRLRFVSEELMRDLEIIKTPKAHKKAYSEITNTAFKAMFAFIKNDRPDMYGALLFMARTGRRVEETTLIERKDIVWDGFNPIRINIRAEITKMKEDAPLAYLDQDLQAHIRAYYQMNKDRKCPYLFLMTKSGRYRNITGYKFNQRRLTEYLAKVSQQILKVKITCHDLRHRFCTETCKARLPLIDIQAISGIKDTKTLIKHYCHASSEGQASVLEKTRL